MNNHDKAVLDLLRTKGPHEAAHIAEALAMEPTGVYQALAALDARRLAVMVKAEHGRHASVRREWEAA